jgi:hypothetical protein
LSIDGYNLETDLRRDREDTVNGLGGGLLIFTKSGLATRKLDIPLNNNFNQYSAFTIMTKNPVHIILIYRPPNSGKNNLDLLCELIENSQENTILVGDFNLPEIDWARKTSGNRGKKFLEATINANFEQLVTFPTHNKGNTLDLVLSNCPARIQSVEEAGKLGNSDHVAIEINVEINVERAEIMKNC